MKYIFHILLLLLFSWNIDSQTLQGRVVGITDGDTFKLLTKDSTLLRIRLANIDCPEKKQAFSVKAKKFASNAIFNKYVTIDILKTDRYKRYIANVFYDDSLNLSYQLVKNGLAWHFIKYSNDQYLEVLEAQAKVEKIGLWSDPNSISPWEWRNRKKKRDK